MRKINHLLHCKFISLILVLFMLYPASIFGKEKKIRSNKATVHYNQSSYKGTMLYADQDLLLLKEKKSEEILGFEFQKIEKISIKKSRAGIGLLIGLGVGVAVTAILIGSISVEQENIFVALLIIPIVVALAIGAGIVISIFTTTAGGMMGLIFGKKKFKLHKMTPERKEVALRKLKKYSLFKVFPEELRSKMIMVEK